MSHGRACSAVGAVGAEPCAGGCGQDLTDEAALLCADCGEAVCDSCIRLGAGRDGDDVCPACADSAEEAKVEQGNKQRRGFRAMDAAKQRAIAARGGKAAHAKGTAHEFTAAEAATAGSKGGAALAARGRSYMAEIGRRGGQARAKRFAGRCAAEAPATALPEQLSPPGIGCGCTAETGPTCDGCQADANKVVG